MDPKSPAGAPRDHRISVAEALLRLPGPGGARFAEVFRRGSLTVEIYNPKGIDPQAPHERDEVYVVVSGEGRFTCDGRSRPVMSGDFLFVPAGAAHRFERFTEDLVVWVLFYGPGGGERAA